MNTDTTPFRLLYICHRIHEHLRCLQNSSTSECGCSWMMCVSTLCCRMNRTQNKSFGSLDCCSLARSSQPGVKERHLMPSPRVRSCSLRVSMSSALLSSEIATPICLWTDEVGSSASFKSSNKKVQHTISLMMYCFLSSTFLSHIARLSATPAFIGSAQHSDEFAPSLLRKSFNNIW